MLSELPTLSARQRGKGEKKRVDSKKEEGMRRLVDESDEEREKKNEVSGTKSKGDSEKKEREYK